MAGSRREVGRLVGNGLDPGIRAHPRKGVVMYARMMSAPGHSRLRKVGRPLRRSLGGLAAAACLLAVVGQIARDRPAPAVYLFYLPALHLAVACMALDGALRGRTVRPRWALFCVGILAALTWLIVSHPARGARLRADDAVPVRLVQWNVQWGGRPHTNDVWREITEQLVLQSPDAIVLSEAPRSEQRNELTKRFGGGWSEVVFENAGGENYWYRVAVLARWPVRLEERFDVPNGVACSVVIDVPRRPLRLLAVDGVSNPSISRDAFLHALARVCDDTHKAGKPIDVIAGDFNALGRSRGFDAIERSAGGYAIAAAQHRWYRATYPASLPLYDIDHVLCARDVEADACHLFGAGGTNHRGECVSIRLGKRP
jgi:endonuclease/exonuclease/phosphatase family metal-dependent hydrolase